MDAVNDDEMRKIQAGTHILCGHLRPDASFCTSVHGRNINPNNKSSQGRRQTDAGQDPLGSQRTGRHAQPGQDGRQEPRTVESQRLPQLMHHDQCRPLDLFYRLHLRQNIQKEADRQRIPTHGRHKNKIHKTDSTYQAKNKSSTEGLWTCKEGDCTGDFETANYLSWLNHKRSQHGQNRTFPEDQQERAVEASSSVDFRCNINYDVFRFMQDNNMAYGFNMAILDDARYFPSPCRSLRSVLGSLSYTVPLSRDCFSLEWSINHEGHDKHCNHYSMGHVSVFSQELLNPIQKYGNSGAGRKTFKKLRLLTNRIMLRRLKKDHTDSMELPSRRSTLIKLSQNGQGHSVDKASTDGAMHLKIASGLSDGHTL
ncbi:Uu.00g001070.m01.CDS01 [Anthostomella pinea]|uniref:Uu.00g001070.m01.CDS01 n=1 Tax=Anthostomella pinea TaxID=933095 RepID=A0AAI8VE04_9PEZI|nr:Uu.00g001070.m01.CDS01 [Anthostomella pinea]